ncbi:MAG: sensor histidine kinase, partial [Sphingobacteriales bacterium]
NNTVRHAGATQVDITLAQEGSHTVMTIADNGKGFTPGAPRTGIGLGNMHSRAAVLGGTLQVHSAPGKGCQLQVRLPLPAAHSTPAAS